MKNWGKFFMMVAVLLSLVACGDKGSGSGGGGTNPINPYSWSELEKMMYYPDLASGYDPNKLELENLKKENDIKDSTIRKQFIDDLIIYMRDSVFFKIINKDNNFNYYSSISEINKQTNVIASILDILTYDDLKLLLEEMNNIELNKPTINDYQKLEVIRKNLDTTITTVSTRKSNNHFYSELARLYYQNKNLKENKDFLSNVYNINLKEIDQSDNIRQSLIVLTDEIDLIEKDTLNPFAEKNNLLVRMRELKTTYERYLRKEISLSNVESIRKLHRDEERFILQGSGTVSSYVLHIEDVHNKLIALNTSGDANKTALKQKFLNEINSYELKNKEYDDKNYIKIASKINNVLSTLSFLKIRKDELTNQLGITVLF